MAEKKRLRFRLRKKVWDNVFHDMKVKDMNLSIILIAEDNGKLLMVSLRSGIPMVKQGHWEINFMGQDAGVSSIERDRVIRFTKKKVEEIINGAT